ncbi:MAG: hypothetical protein AB9842_06070 [Bacteroidales bacterium]
MEEEIKNNLDQPRRLERLYREDKNRFKKAFDRVYNEIQDHLSAQIWNERLHYDSREISWGTKNELIYTLTLAFIAGLIAKLPDFTQIQAEYFYQRNISFIVFPGLAAYFAWKQNLTFSKLLVISVTVIISVVYINLLPGNDSSDTLLLACIHLPLFLWTLTGFSFTGTDVRSYPKRIEFLKYNGDLLVMAAVILIAGGILSAVTIGLFELINIRIEEFYFKYIAIWGLAASPVLCTYLVQSNPQLVKKVSPIVAKVFTPLVLATLIVYLAAIIYTGKDPYNDREFLMIFNVMLLGVMAIIFFSVAEASKNSIHKISIWMLSGLSLVTIIINLIALSAIVFRIFEWGITPNRLAVLGSNILIFINLLMVAYRLVKSAKNADQLVNLENSIASYLPVYSIWTLIVAFLFPLIFQFR